MARLPPWTPDVHTLDLLISVAELGSVGQAAAAHGISQPSASSRLSRLERQVGAALLNRTSRGSTLTPTGEAVVAWARPVVEAAHGLSDGIATLRADQQARLRVAASLTIAEFLMPDWLLLLRRQRPNLVTAVQVANSHVVTDQVRAGAVELGFIEAPQAPPSVHQMRIGVDRLSLVVAATYPLAHNAGQSLPVRDVIEHPFLLREPGSGTRDTFMHALTGLVDGIDEPRQTVELGSTATIVATTAAGGGIGVVSARAVRTELASGKLVELSVDGMELERPLHAIWINQQLSDAASNLLDVAATAGRA